MTILLGILAYIVIGQILTILIIMEEGDGKYKFDLTLHLFMGIAWPLVIF